MRAEKQASPAWFWSWGTAIVLLLWLLMWLNSGTLTLYAATHEVHRLETSCNYLYNIDHPHFKATFLMLDGAPREEWQVSPVLRRILYPLLAYPFMKWTGYEIGGFITNLLLHAAALLICMRVCLRRWGRRAALTFGVLLATYPGVMYWAGSPYSYASIVPACLLAYAALLRIAEASAWKEIMLLSLWIGVLFLAYDIFPFFVPAVLLVLIVRRRWKLLPGALAALFIPGIVGSLILGHWFDVPLNNSNTVSYVNIVKSFIAQPDFAAWTALVLDAPRILVHNYLFSNFLILPLAFPILACLGARLFGTRVSLTETALLLSALAVFSVNNLAPPYTGWQLRGDWIARIYQPVFVVYLFYLARLAGDAARAAKPDARALVQLLLLATVLADFLVCTGPALRFELADYVYYNFYRHNRRGALMANVEKYGVRPLGICGDLLNSPEADRPRRRKHKAA